MSWTYELMYLPTRHAGSYVLVTSRGASRALRIYAEGASAPTRIDGKELPSLAHLAAEARAAGKPTIEADKEHTDHVHVWWPRISAANRAAGLTAHVVP